MLCVWESSDGWLVAQDFFERVLIRSSMPWLLTFNLLELHLNRHLSTSLFPLPQERHLTAHRLETTAKSRKA